MFFLVVRCYTVKEDFSYVHKAPGTNQYGQTFSRPDSYESIPKSSTKEYTTGQK